jgi:hypothetical protein
MKIFLQALMITLLSVLSAEIGGAYGQNNTATQQMRKYELKDFVLPDDYAKSILIVGNNICKRRTERNVQTISKGKYFFSFGVGDGIDFTTIKIIVHDIDHNNIIDYLCSDSVIITESSKPNSISNNTNYALTRRIILSSVNGIKTVIAYDFITINPVDGLGFMPVSADDTLTCYLSISAGDIADGPKIWIRPSQTYLVGLLLMSSNIGSF